MILKNFCGFKVGMSQLFDGLTRRVVPVTALTFKPLVVLRSMPNESRLVLAIGEAQNGSKPEKIIYHLNLDKSFAGESKFAVGATLDLSSFSLKEGDLISVTAKSRGHGFAGVMKRHGFAGGPGGHGSNFHRQPGSSGSIRSTGKCIKGRRMPGRMGFERVTVKGLRVIKVDSDLNCVFVKGAVPGKRSSLIGISCME